MLRKTASGSVHTYTAHWESHGPTCHHLKPLAEAVYEGWRSHPSRAAAPS